VLARHHEDCVHAGNRLGLDDVLALPAVAGIHNFFQFDDNRLGTAILDGIDADGLTAHPIDVEAHHRVDGRAALSAAYCSGMTETPKPGSARDCRPIYIGGSHRLALRNKAVAGGIAHQRHAALFPAKSRKGRSHLARFICPSIPEQKKPDRLCAT